MRVRTDGDEIGPKRSVIVVSEANRPAMVPVDGGVHAHA